MKSKTTSIWFILALALFACIWFLEKYLQPAAPSANTLIPGLRAADVVALQIIPAGAREISVLRTNGGWLLQKPLAYPAQAAAVDLLASALEKLTPATRLTAAEMHDHKNTDTELGFDNPKFTLVVEAANQRRQLIVGNKTAPGDQVFVRIIGLDGAFVVDAGWLALLPLSASEWRDTALVDAAGTCDWIIVTNGTKTMEFRYDVTNQLWRMLRPLQARADGARLAAAFQQLCAGRITQFVNDDARDLSSYGLQPAELGIWLGHGTNFNAAIHAGKTVPTNSAQLYARREGWSTVATADKDVFVPWRGAVNDFRDTHLVTTTAPVTEIELRGENHFTLQQTGSNAWVVAGEKFSADAENVQAFLKLLADLRVAEFVKDVVTGPDLQGFGLVTPSREIILRGKAADTNAVLAQLLFGASDTNRIFVKRGDEDFVYALRPDTMARIPESGWEFRNRRVWSFSETNVAQVTLRQGGKTRVLIRTGDEKWSLGPGSQGIINPPAIEETMHRLGELTAAGWVGRNITEPEKFGLDKGSLSMTIDLKTGEKLNLDFGTELPQGQTALAAVTLDGERWAFVFPPVLFQFVTTYLTIPANTP